MKMQMTSNRAKRAIGTIALAAAVLFETIACPTIGKILQDKEAAKQGGDQQISMKCNSTICDEDSMRQFEINFGETALLNFVPAVRIGIGVESDLIKAFTMAETGFKLLEQGDMDAGTKLLLPYVRAIHRNAFGYDAPPSTLLAIMGAYEFDRLKQILGNFRSGLEVAEAFYIDDNNTIYMPTMEDLETTLSVVFHEMGHAKDNVEFNKSSNEFTSEAIGFYLDLVSCRNRIGTSGGADTIEGEIYLDNDGMPLLLKPDVCRRIPEEILESWVSFMVLKSGDDESHAMGRINFMFEMAERGSIREAMDAVIMAEPQAMKERVDSEIVHMEAPEFYERMLEVNDVVMEFIYSDGKESGEKHFVQSFSFSCNVGEMRDNEGIIRYCQEYAPRGSDLTPMKFLGRSLDDANNAGFAHFCSDGFGAPLGGTSCKVSFITEGEVQIGTAHATRAESAEAKK